MKRSTKCRRCNGTGMKPTTHHGEPTDTRLRKHRPEHTGRGKMSRCTACRGTGRAVG